MCTVNHSQHRDFKFTEAFHVNRIEMQCYTILYCARRAVRYDTLAVALPLQKIEFVTRIMLTCLVRQPSFGFRRIFLLLRLAPVFLRSRLLLPLKKAFPL